MLIIAEAHIPSEAREALARIGTLAEFSTEGITYKAISGHPDIFFSRSKDGLITAANTPAEFLEFLVFNCVKYKKGLSAVGQRYPESAHYNCVMNNGRIIHNLKITDRVLLESSDEQIHVNQGYTRCSLIELDGDAFITSDEGVSAALKKKGFDVLSVPAEGISLPGFAHGFIGGTCGIIGKEIFFLGSLRHYGYGTEVRSFLKKHNYNITELCDTPLYDGGSLIIIE